MKFSLLVPSYNRPDLIRETVLSLVANSGPDVEIIVGDDASPRQEEIRQVLSDLIAAGAVQFLAHQRNAGWSRNRNSLVQAASGEFVILLGDDDHLKPGALARIRRWISALPGHDAYAIGYDIIDTEGAHVYSRICPGPTVYSLKQGDNWRELFYMDAIQMWSHHPFTMAVRRKALLEIPYNPGVGIADDMLFQFELIAAGGSILAIPESLFEWRFAISATSVYRNLSSDESRSILAHRQIWLALLGSKTSVPKVREHITSATWIQRFLRTDSDLARRLSRRTRAGDGIPLGMQDPDLQAKSTFRPGLFHKMGKVFRVARIFGPVHFANVLRYWLDRKLHLRRVSGLSK